MKIGRNDLCPCGSGIKYKKCCLNGTPRPQARPIQKPALSVMANHPATSQKNTTVSQVRETVQQVITDKNSKSDKDQSSEQVQQADGNWQCRAMTVLLSVAESCGVKATATGKFARNFCQQHAEALLDNYCAEDKSIRGEADLPILSCIRELAVSAGLIELQKGKFVVTAAAQNQVAEQQYVLLYQQLVSAANLNEDGDLTPFGLECQ